MNLNEVDLRSVYNIWKNNLGTFRCFFRSTPFVSLQTYENFILDEYKKEYKNNLEKQILEYINNKYFIIVDLPFDEILDLALEFNNKYLIKPILNINLLFHPFGVIGNNKNISKLINNGMKLNQIKSEKYIMFIPYDRYNEGIDVSKIYDKLNNQYAVGEDDLPSYEFLKKLNYNGVVVVTKDNVKEDIKNFINYFQNEFKVKLVKVDK